VSGLIRVQGHGTRLTGDRHLTYAWYAVGIGVCRASVGGSQWVARGLALAFDVALGVAFDVAFDLGGRRR